jgi:glycosyltransferase involved in cell wall biosynthesis
LLTLEALRSCCERVDAVSLATANENATVHAEGVLLIPRLEPPSRRGYVEALARGGSSFVDDRGGAISQQIRALVAAGALLPRYDVVWSHFSLMAEPGLAVASSCRLLDIDNSWGAIRRRALAGDDGSLLHRAYLRLDAAAVTRSERRRCEPYGQVVVSSEGERERLGPVRPPVSVVENSALPADRKTPPARERHGLLFVGTLDTQPNIDAVRFLTQDVLPAVRAGHPAATLTVAGRGPTEHVRRMCAAAGAELVADAPSLEPLYSRARAVVAPLWLGGGTRIKILEALARSQPVVATPIAAEGLRLQDETNVLLARDAHQFAGQCVRLLGDAALADRMGAAARATWHARFRPEVARAAVLRVIERACQASAAQRMEA